MVVDLFLLFQDGDNVEELVVERNGKVDIKELLDLNLGEVDQILLILLYQKVDLRLFYHGFEEVKTLIEVVDLERHLKTSLVILAI